MILLTRFAYLETCTLGTLSVGSLLLKTLELPWIPNPLGQGGMPQHSCVPDGDYTVLPHSSESKPNTYQLVSYPLGVYQSVLPAGQTWGRTEILIHIANTVEELLGCIAVGTEHMISPASRGEYSVLNSRNAMDQLRAAIGEQANTYMTIQPTRGTV